LNTQLRELTIEEAHNSLYAFSGDPKALSTVSHAFEINLRSGVDVHTLLSKLALTVLFVLKVSLLDVLGVSNPLKIGVHGISLVPINMVYALLVIGIRNEQLSNLSMNVDLLTSNYTLPSCEEISGKITVIASSDGNEMLHSLRPHSTNVRDRVCVFPTDNVFKNFFHNILRNIRLDCCQYGIVFGFTR
jgi:hypothetical protein